jgi:hypothetical protein
MTGPTLTRRRTGERHLRSQSFDVAAPGDDVTGLMGMFRVHSVEIKWDADTLGGQWEFGSVALRGPKYRADGTLGARSVSAYYDDDDLADAPDWVQQLVADETKALVNP